MNSVSILAIVLSAPALAGTGKYHDGVFDFTVLFCFDATPQQQARVQDAFAAASNLLLGATSNQHRFGKITYTNDQKSFGADAEFIVSAWEVALLPPRASTELGR